MVQELSIDRILKLSHEYLEIHMMMSVSYTSFAEREDKEEDIYNVYLKTLQCLFK